MSSKNYSGESAAVKKVRALQAKKKRPRGKVYKKGYTAGPPPHSRKSKVEPGSRDRSADSSSSSSSSSDSYEDDLSDSYYSSEEEEQEDTKDYKKGGYHPVMIGDVYNKQYKVIRKLGWGHFSTVWLCWDERNNRYVALKIVKSAKHYTETALDEIELLKKVADSDPDNSGWKHVVQMHDSFKLSGPHGSHMCMVFEVLGHNLLKPIIKSSYRGLPIPAVHRIIRQVLLGVDYLHQQCGIIHTDIKPENILLCVSPAHVKKLAVEGAHSRSAVSSAPPTAPSAAVRKQQPLTKNQKKKLKKKLKKAASLQQAKALSKDNNGTSTTTEPSQKPDGEKEGKSVITNHRDGEEGGNVVKENGLMDIGEGSCVTSTAQSTRDTPTSVARGKSEVSSVSEGPQSCNHEDGDKEEGGVAKAESGKDEEEEEVEEEEEEKEEEEDYSKWGSLKVPVTVKIADLGNACWVDKHFTDDIQTRQYRCLEVLIGAGYGTPSDIWSIACMAFELATGDYLFEPHSGHDYCRDEDHLAHIIELLGPIPRHLALAGRYSHEFFNKRGELRHIHHLRPWKIQEVLMEKYRWNSEDSDRFASFLLPMLDYNPSARATAEECLQHSWIKQYSL